MPKPLSNDCLQVQHYTSTYTSARAHGSAPDSGSSSLGASPGQLHCVVLGKTLYSHITSLSPGVFMLVGTSEFDAGA